jgi:hypothetical protein
VFEAWLFEDVEYGQWGLHLLNAQACADRTAAELAERPEDFASDDIVIGEVLGDSELLVCAPSEDVDRRYLIALPLDPRNDWSAAGSSVSEVLGRYLASEVRSTGSRDSRNKNRPRRHRDYLQGVDRMTADRGLVATGPPAASLWTQRNRPTPADEIARPTPVAHARVAPSGA